MWQEKEQKLCRRFTFKNFKEAFAFMVQVALVAEAHNHHPWWSNVYNQVDIELTTHDAGNQITAKDRVMADMIDKIYTLYS